MPTCLVDGKKQLTESGDGAFPGKGHLSPLEEEVRRLQRDLKTDRDTKLSVNRIGGTPLKVRLGLARRWKQSAPPRRCARATAFAYLAGPSGSIGRLSGSGILQGWTKCPLFGTMPQGVNRRLLQVSRSRSSRVPQTVFPSCDHPRSHTLAPETQGAIPASRHPACLPRASEHHDTRPRYASLL